MMYAEFFENLRLMTRYINDRSIKKDDIVSILPKDNGVVLMYYKDSN